MKLIISSVFVCLMSFCHAQYYYNDIVTAKQTTQQYLVLKNSGVREISAASFEADGSPTDDFTLVQQISGNGSLITTITDFPATGRAESIASYSNNRIVKTVDTTDKIKKTTTYAYDGDVLNSITTEINDEFMNNSSIEVHQYFYENNRPVKMFLIKNSTDTTVVEFIPDEQQNIAEEHWLKKNQLTQKYFYYYNQRHQLTDVVHFNTKANQLLPDFVFEYNEDGTIRQMTQVPQGSDDYLIWLYEYDSNGLKKKERCFNKQKQLVGRIEYSFK
ncbi:MAG TPA: hypothetical protein PKM63_20765 [Panacibacter sp.]|nr:hypothetical protein [Panacibacter sp.]HNP46742.1 hypothetical protein [Panacibacter sp.]